VATVSGRAFWFDASACSGCKACQVACKDRHGLPLGVRWRRVYEVAGGGWTRRDGAWLHDVLAYNVSMACNHCAEPICAEVCPTGAISKRPDGLVLLDADRCTGCRYCAWVCPYGAPQYDAGRGRMTKCSFCADDLDRGHAPACVSACPERVLDFGTREDLEARHGRDAPLHPLPDPSLTSPSLVVRPHGQAERAAAEGARVANAEEVRPVGGARAASEASLVAFTLLAQTAVGMLAALVLGPWISGAGRAVSPGRLAALAPGGVAAVAAAISLLHLGAPVNAWRALAGLRSSWLSREILLLLAFLAGWVGMVALGWAEPAGGPSSDVDPPAALGIVAGLTVLAGLGLLYAMSRVYRVRTLPAWDSALTPLTFFLSAGSLGGMGAALTLTATWGDAGAVRSMLLLAAACVAAELALVPLHRRHRRTARTRVVDGLAPPRTVSTRGDAARAALLGTALVGVLAVATGSGSAAASLAALASALAAGALAAVLGRVAFYASHARRGL